MNYRAFYDRKKKFFTIQDEDGDKIFNRISARSGQAGYQDTEWTPRKSPIPFGTFWLWTKSINVGTNPGRTGIGEFFYISSGDNPLVITDGVHQRHAIGLHAENAIPGSAGCIVIVNQGNFDDIAEFLRKLTQKRIQLTVL